MPVETSAVEIRINVTDANSGTVIAQLERSFNQMGNAGGAAGTKVSNGMKQISGHALTSLDNVRLLRDDLGIRIPRSMEKAIASSHALMGVISGIGTGLLAVGAIDIGIRIAEGLKRGYDQWFSLTTAARAYQEEVSKNKDKDFFDTHSIETTTLRINDATDAIHKFAEAAASAQKKSQWWSVGGIITSPMTMYYRHQAHTDLDQQYAAQRQVDQLKPRQEDQTHERNVQQVELNHALDGELRGRAKITAELQKQRELNAETSRHQQAQDSMLGNPVDAKSARSEQQTKDATAQREADAQTFNLEREQGIELRHLREQASEAGLQGVALYRAQESAAIADLRDKDMDSVAARAAVHAKFHADELKRLRDEEVQTQKIEREASAAGLTGLAKTQAEGANRVADIQEDQTLDPAQRVRRAAAAQAQGNAEMLAQEQEFTSRVNSLVDASDQHQISGFARIAAERKKQLDDLQKEFDSQYGHLDITKPGGLEAYAQGSSQLDRGTAAINTGANQQASDLARKNADETAQIEEQARARSMSAEKQQTAAIEQQYEERVRKYQEELNQQEISQEDFNRRVAAAAEERNAEMVQQAQEARAKIAGEMRGLFGPHPLQALQEMGSKYAAEAGASVLQRVGNHFGGHTVSPESAMNRLAGVPGTHAGRGGAAMTSTAAGSMSIAQAQIYVNSASIMGGAPGGGAGSAPGGFGPGTFAGSGSTRSGGGVGASSPSGGWGGGTLFSGNTSGSSAGAGGGMMLGNAGASAPSGGWTGGGVGGGMIGGAGSSSIGSAASGIASPAISRSGGAAGAVNLAATGISDAKTLKGMFSGAGNAGAGTNSAVGSGGLQTSDPLAGTQTTLNADGTSTTGAAGSSAYSQSMIGGGMTMSNTLGAAGAGLGLFSAYKQGGVGGMMSGAMSGAQLGMMVGGPIGAGIGAVAGLALGVIGGAEQARLYDERQVRPRIGNDTTAYNNGSMDYSSAYSDLENLMTTAKSAMTKMGFAGKEYYENTVEGELKRAMSNLTREQRAGRSQYGVNAAQFAVGSDSIPHTGMAVLHEGERVFPSDQNERITRAIEGQTKMPAQSDSGWQGDLHVHAIDAKSSVQFLMDNKHTVRSAMNASYGENSGGADAGY